MRAMDATSEARIAVKAHLMTSTLFVFMEQPTVFIGAGL
jgi:hypothetical protein